MPSSSQTAALLARYALTPGVGVGPLRFGDPVGEHPQLELRQLDPEERYTAGGWDDDDDGDEDEDEDADGDDGAYTEYTIAGLDEIMVVYVDRDQRIDSVAFYELCLVDGRDLIGMGVGELLVRLGVPSAIDTDELGPDADLLYGYDRLGLTLWTIDGEVCVVHAGLADR